MSQIGQRRRLSDLRIAMAVVLIAGTWCSANAHASVFNLTVVDESGQTLPCRVLIRPQGQECIVPSGAVEVRLGPDRWFMSTGEVELTVPEGECTLRVEHGLEYVRVKEVLRVAEPESSKTIVLKRWINMKERGYLCGESHLHIDSKSLGPMLIGDGMDFGSSLTWWNGEDARRPIPPGNERIRELSFAGRTVPVSIYDAELEYGWGAVYLLNLPEPLPLKSDAKRPNLDYLKYAADVGGLVVYQSGWGPEAGVDALMGIVPIMNVCNNNFHMHRFQPRTRYSNLLQVEGFPEYPGTDQGMLRLNYETYYRFLNWGLHIAVGAGTAAGVKQNPAGYNRAYVRAESGTTLPEFHRAWAKGGNFATNGPMVFLQTDQGQRPGDSIDLPAQGGRIRLRVEVLSDQELTSVEIVQNGEVAATIPIGDPHHVNIETELEVTRGAWIAARCQARDNILSDEELVAYTNGSMQHPSRLRFAHTSPMYVTVAGEGAAVRKSIQEGLLMMDRFDIYARKNAGPDYLPEILKAAEAGRSKLQSRLKVAETE